MKEKLRPWLLGAWLGFALGVIAKINFMQWEFYAILIPTVIIVALFYLD